MSDFPDWLKDSVPHVPGSYTVEPDLTQAPGYLTVTLDYKVKVSRRIREEFENGRHYYALDGQPLAVLPSDAIERPAPEHLERHHGIFKN
jgi:hypothetical protein